MFGSKTKIYTVHINPDKENPLESTVLVREGFSFYAFLFNVPWALYHRMWREAFWLAIIVALFAAASEFGWVEAQFLLPMQMIFNFFVGFEANNFRRNALFRRGYVMSDVVVSSDELAGEQRYFERIATA